MFATLLTTITTIWRPGFKPDLRVVGSIAGHACDDASKRILKLPTYQLKIFLAKYQNL